MQTGPCPSVTTRTAYGLCAYVDQPTQEMTPLPDGWMLSPDWGGTQGPNNGIYAVVAEHQSNGQKAIAIQGTRNLLDLLKDFHVVPQPAFPYVQGARIAEGSESGLRDLLGLKNTKGTTLQSYLMSLSGGTCLLVTGHSLGGNLSSVLGPWIAANVPAFDPPPGGTLSALPANLSVMTFAAPTAGNASFAEFLDAQSNYQAFFNTNDAIPYAWSTTAPWDAKDINNLFPSPGPSPAPDLVKALIETRLALMHKYDVSYMQTRGTTFTFPPRKPPDGVKAPWLWELSYEHNTAYAIEYLGQNATTVS